EHVESRGDKSPRQTLLDRPPLRHPARSQKTNDLDPPRSSDRKSSQPGLTTSILRPPEPRSGSARIPHRSDFAQPWARIAERRPHPKRPRTPVLGIFAAAT